MTRYIHLNPVTAGHVQAPADWRYSSYREHIGQRDGTLPQTHHVLHQFRDPSHYQAFVEEEQKESRIIADLVFD